MKRALPQFAVCALDKDEDQLRQYETLFKGKVNIRFLSYSEERLARARLERNAKTLSIEPVVIVTDRVGVVPPGASVVDGVRALYPHCRIILHSGGARPSQVTELAFNRKTIHDYLPKSRNSNEELLARVQIAIDSYTRLYPLAQIRKVISECSDPGIPFLSLDEKRCLNLYDIYAQILLGTTLGDELATAWDDMIGLWVSPTNRVVNL